MITRYLQEQDLPQAREIWEEAFDDKPAFVDWYFRRRFRPGEGVGIFSGSLLLCDLHLAPYRIKLRGRTFPTAYLVGLATREEYRRQGLAKELLTFALRSLREKGVFFTFLMPFAIPFYTRLGWGVCGQHRIYRLAPGAGIPGEESPGSPGKPGRAEKESPSEPTVAGKEDAPDPALLDRIYRNWSSHLDGWLLRGEEDWEGLLFDHFLDGGEVWLLKEAGSGPTAYALFYPGAKENLLRELAYLTPVPAAGCCSIWRQETANRWFERTGCGHALSFTGTGGETGFPGADHRSQGRPGVPQLPARPAGRLALAGGRSPSSREQRGFPSYPGKRRENASHPRPGRGCRSHLHHRRSGPSPLRDNRPGRGNKKTPFNRR